MIIGYARVSTEDQDINIQVESLQKAGCERIYQEKISGTSANRPEYKKMKEALRTGDTLMVWKLDRLGRSLKELLITIDELQEQGVGFKSITDNIDPATPDGRRAFLMLATFSEMESNINKERTRAGMAAARARGRLGGRKPALSPMKQKMLKKMYDDKAVKIDNILTEFNISRPTMYKYLKLNGDENNG